MNILVAYASLTIHILRCLPSASLFLGYVMHTAKLHRPGLPSAGAKPALAIAAPDKRQAAAYIYDMTASMRDLAQRHGLATLALVLEMAAIEAATARGLQVGPQGGPQA
jgi:hypothetical protein